MPERLVLDLSFDIEFPNLFRDLQTNQPTDLVLGFHPIVIHFLKKERYAMSFHGFPNPSNLKVSRK